MIKLSRNTLRYEILKRHAFDDRVTENEVVWPGIRFCYVVSGGCVWKINGQKHEIDKGDIIFFSDTQSRAISKIGKDGLKVLAILLAREAFESPKHYAFYCGVAKQMNGVIKNSDLSKIAEEIYIETVSQDEDSLDFLSAKFTEFFIKAERIFANIKTEAFSDEKMVDIIKIIDQRFFEGIGLAEISKIASLSESTFSRRFKKCFGISFKRYLMMKKIEKATYLLKNTDKKVMDVAYECGFNSVSGFYDTFKKITGTTPENITSQI